MLDGQIRSQTSLGFGTIEIDNLSHNKPRSAVSAGAPVTSFILRENHSASYPTSPSAASEMSTSQRHRSADSSTSITLIEEYSVGISRREVNWYFICLVSSITKLSWSFLMHQRRKQQNRNSQRAFRERTRLREEQLNGQVSDLQLKVEMLRSQESLQNQVIEALIWENETLKELLAM